MKLIAHRGLTNGPDSVLENTTVAIESAIQNGFDVEVDIWKIQDKIYLGHDEPKESVELEFLLRPQIWAHAKNLEALQYMLANKVHCFWHEDDQYTITSMGYIWTYPGRDLTDMSVMVMPERVYNNLSGITKTNCYAICSDFVGHLV
jgi:hypothetical protein